MGKQNLYTFEQDLQESLRDPAFRLAWRESEPDYLLAKQLIEKRLAKNLSQRDLAKKVQTSQAVISRIESMSGNPTLGLLKRLATALDTRFEISIGS